MKFCRDCDHLKTFDGFHRCRAPENVVHLTPDLVTGRERSMERMTNPETCRQMESECGKNARWFKPRFGPVARLLHWSLVKWPTLKK